MAFSLFNEDEKNKITDSFNSLGIPQETVQTTDFMSYDSKNDDRKKLDDEIIAKNKALEDIISNQRMEENQIKDDYDSLGSRANRFLQVFGAGLRGDNASQVAQSLSDRLDKRLQGAQARYKDQRDSAYTQYKDLLARREALNKSDYDRQRDQAKDQQWEQEFGLKTKTQADQNAIQQAQLDILRDQATEKKNQEIQNAQNENANKVLELQQFNDDVNDFLNTYSNSGVYDRFFGDGSTEKNQITDAKRQRLNYKILKRLFPGLSDKELIDKYDEMKDILLNPSQSKKEAIDRLKALNVIE